MERKNNIIRSVKIDGENVKVKDELYKIVNFKQVDKIEPGEVLDGKLKYTDGKLTFIPLSSNKKNSIVNVVWKRNKRLINFFTSSGLPFRIIGKSDTPIIILDNKFILPGYVKNFWYHFTEYNFSREIIKSIKLKNNSEIVNIKRYGFDAESQMTLFEFINLLKGISSTPIFCIKDNNNNKFIGWDDNGNPIFNNSNPRLYYTSGKVEDVIRKIININSSLQINVSSPTINMQEWLDNHF